MGLIFFFFLLQFTFGAQVITKCVLLINPSKALFK